MLTQEELDKLSEMGYTKDFLKRIDFLKNKNKKNWIQRFWKKIFSPSRQSNRIQPQSKKKITSNFSDISTVVEEKHRTEETRSNNSKEPLLER